MSKFWLFLSALLCYLTAVSSIITTGHVDALWMIVGAVYTVGLSVVEKLEEK